MTAVGVVAFLGLAIVGLDPFGGIVAAGAIARGARPRALLALLGTYVVLISLEILALHPILDWAGRVLAPILRSPAVWSAAQIAVALACAGIAVHQGLALRRPPAPRTSSAGVSVRAMMIAAALLAVTSLPDPPFVAAVGLASRVDALPVRIALLVAWNVLYQAPMLVLAIAGLTPLRERAERAWIDLLARWRTPLRRALVAVLVLTAAALGAEAAVALTHGSFPWLHALLAG